jgi:hypothetical protein
VADSSRAASISVPRRETIIGTFPPGFVGIVASGVR